MDQYADANDVVVLAPISVRCWNTHSQEKQYKAVVNYEDQKEQFSHLKSEKNFGNRKGPEPAAIMKMIERLLGKNFGGVDDY